MVEVWEQDGKHVCQGYSTILNQGEVVCKAEPFAEILLQYAIPKQTLRDEAWHDKWHRRFIGNKDLNKIMCEAYEKRALRPSKN